MFIWRDDQVWVEGATSDQSFLAEDHLKDLFSALDRAGVHVRMMQQHATHFGLVTDRDDIRLQTLEELLGQAFQVRREDGLLLLTVRHGSGGCGGAGGRGHHASLDEELIPHRLFFPNI